MRNQRKSEMVKCEYCGLEHAIDENQCFYNRDGLALTCHCGETVQVTIEYSGVLNPETTREM